MVEEGQLECLQRSPSFPKTKEEVQFARKDIKKTF
jgi:hypothetical protein